jgi:hypothetical protein
MTEIKQLGINTHTLVLIWASFKSLAQLCERIHQHHPTVVNYTFDPAKEDRHHKFLKEQQEIWEVRAIEVKDFLSKYAWCKKNQTYTAFIKINSSSGKEEEYEKLLSI